MIERYDLCVDGIVEKDANGSFVLFEDVAKALGIPEESERVRVVHSKQIVHLSVFAGSTDLGAQKVYEVIIDPAQEAALDIDFLGLKIIARIGSVVPG